MPVPTLRRRRILTDESTPLSVLLSSHGNVSTSALAQMALQSYFPQSPRNVSDGTQNWMVEIVTPIAQGVNGSLVQAVLFHKNDERLLAFTGVLLYPNTDTANPYLACMAADYQFVGTDAEAAWHYTCTNESTTGGPVDANLTEWATQAHQLVRVYQPTLLSGHSLGCATAVSEGLRSNLPVVCFSASSHLSQRWMSDYPGLWNDNLHNNNNDNDLFVLQTYTDPYSNCLEPTPSIGVANMCGFPGRSAVGGCGRNSTFRYDPFSDCVRQSHYVSNILSVPLEFEQRQCVSRQVVGTATQEARFCPHHHNHSTPTTLTTGNSSSSSSSSAVLTVSPIVSLLLVTITCFLGARR